jgi:arabinofuranan 3-O-arabinosyltransferase
MTATLGAGGVQSIRQASTHPRPAPCADPLSRWVLVWLGALFLVVAFVQAPGLITFDSKLPVMMAPWSWMQASLHLWNPTVGSGSVQDAMFGYLFPMGPFFAVTHLVHLPVWFAERMWLALLLTVGAWGMIRLAEALGIGRRWARVLGAIAYCVAPIVVDWAAISVYLLAVVLLPWVLRPLVVGSSEGSPRQAAARSGVAVALMGGVNATVVVAVLPLAFLWFLTRAPGPRRRSLLGWWVVSVGLASFWWLGATVLQGKYGLNYLLYTETSSTTTQTASLFATLRGTSNWQNYFDIGSPVVPGGQTLVKLGVAIFATSVVSALGIAGLARRIPERLFLVASLGFGVLAITIGYTGALGGPFSHQVVNLLAGTLAPLRSVAKFLPCVALPLALGLTSLVSTVSIDGKREGWLRFLVDHRGRLLTGTVAVVVVFIAAIPFWRPQLYAFTGFTSIPNYWTQTADWLDAHQGNQTSLLVPGSAFADNTWGRPRDEPLSMLARTSVTTRSVIPLGLNGNFDMLSTFGYALASGTPQPGFAPYLSRSGIDYVVERNDLNLHLTGVPPPAQIHQVLSETPGLVQVAAFGPYLPRSQVTQGILPVYSSPRSVHLRSVEIYQVEPSGSEVHAYSAANPLVVSGSAQSLLSLAGTGLPVGRATVLSRDPRAASAQSKPEATWTITDGNQRRAAQFGVVNDNLSYLLGPDQRDGRPLTQPLMRATSGPMDAQTVFAPFGAASATATSFGSSGVHLEPSEGPASAFDGDPATAWVATGASGSVGQAITLNVFDKAVPLPSITITQLDRSPYRPSIKWVTINWDTGSVRRYIPASNGPVRIGVTSQMTRDLQIVIDAVRPAVDPLKPPLGAGITDISIPGVKFRPAMQLPSDMLAKFSDPSRNLPVLSLYDPVANPNLNFAGSVTAGQPMARKFVLPKAMTASLDGTAVPNPGAPLDRLLTQVADPVGQTLNVTASSWLRDLPRFRAENLVEARSSPWIAGLSDRDPSLTLRWAGVRTISSLSIGVSYQASRPTRMVISSSEGTREVSVPRNGGTVSFAPMTTDSLTIHFGNVIDRVSTVPTGGFAVGLTAPRPIALPVGLSSISVPALGTAVGSPSAPTTPVALPCGSGPTVTLNGTELPTRVTGTIGELVDLQPMVIRTCQSAMAHLPAGDNVVSFPSGNAFRVTSLLVEPPGLAGPHSPSTAARTVRVVSSNPAVRTLRVSAGPATYVQIAQNFNAGWVATFEGKTLAPIMLDGWQQGWKVPAGSAGTITMNFAPDHAFRGILLLGAFLLILLFVLAFGFRGRSTSESIGPRSKLPGWMLAGVAAVVMICISGWLALLLVPLIAVARRWGSSVTAAIGSMTFAVAGVVAALLTNTVWNGDVGFARTLQIGAAMALGAIFTGLIVDEQGPSKSALSVPDGGPVAEPSKPST